MRRARLPPPRSHKCEAQDTLRHANLLNGGLAFATAKIHPSFVRFAHKFPPSFCLRSSRSLIRYRHVSAFGVHLLLRNSLCYLICPALWACPPTPVSCASHPPVLCTCGLRVPSGHFGSSLRSDLLRSAGEGVRRKALKISNGNNTGFPLR